MNARPLRCTLVWLTSTAAEVLATVLLHGDVVALAGGPGADLEQALVRCGSAVLLGCVTWGWLATCAVSLQAVRGRATTLRGVPAPLRRLVLAACGASLVAGLSTGLTAPAGADPGLAGLPLPDRAAGGPAPQVAAMPLAGRATVTVRPGDSLWTLAAADLGPEASPAEVDRHWHRIHRLNRPLLGPDPDLIHPGQQLRLPPPPQETS